MTVVETLLLLVAPVVWTWLVLEALELRRVRLRLAATTSRGPSQTVTIAADVHVLSVCIGCPGPLHHPSCPARARRVELTTDAPLTGADMAAVRRLIHRTVHERACVAAEDLYDQVVDQVAHDEAAAGLDDALERITRAS